MKNFFRNLILLHKNDPVAFVSVLTLFFAFILIPLLRYAKPSYYSSIIITSSTIALILIINYVFYKTAKKHAFKKPDEPDSQCDFYLLETTQGEIYLLGEKAIWSENGKDYKIIESDNYDEGRWIVKKDHQGKEKCYVLTTNLRNILDKDISGKVEISIAVNKNFNPVEIFSIYRENDLEIYDKSVYINKALITAIKEKNKDNQKLENIEKLNLNEYLTEFLKEKIAIPNFKNMKSYEINFS